MSHAFCIMASTQYANRGYPPFFVLIDILYADTFWSVLSNLPMVLLYKRTMLGWLISTRCPSCLFHLDALPLCWTPTQFEARVTILLYLQATITKVVKPVVSGSTFSFFKRFEWLSNREIFHAVLTNSASCPDAQTAEMFQQLHWREEMIYCYVILQRWGQLRQQVKENRTT